ncbi:hypothetical protein [Bartonella tribocorum]|nr:hypothetical protein [Bartonella tribocorum]
MAIFWIANRIGVLAWIVTGSFSKNVGIISRKRIKPTGDIMR